jgi:7-cyano-7-deazaguanine reductase
VPDDPGVGDELTLLGAEGVTKPSKRLETFPNRARDRYYLVRIGSAEFTCVCPLTGQPDFAEIRVRYVPDARVVESKSFKLYLWSYRDEGVFHEHLVNRILDDLVAACAPHWCEVSGVFNARGGVAITVEAEHTRTAAARDQWR